MTPIKRTAEKVLKLKIKSADYVCLWRDSNSVAEGVSLTWREVRAMALHIQKAKR